MKNYIRAIRTNDHRIMNHLGVVIAVYNEEKNLNHLCERLVKNLEAINPHFEIILVDDGSRDSSWKIIEKLHLNDARIKGLRFSRNFGQHTALTAGLHVSNSEYVVLMDADLQDLPEEIYKLYSKINEGYEIVYGYRKERKDTFLKKWSSSLFNQSLYYLTDKKINRDIVTFRIMTRRVVDKFQSFNEQNLFLSGLIAWLGFNYTSIPIEHGKRHEGTSKYNFYGLIKLALDGIFSFSRKPLRWISYFGFFLSLIAGFVGSYIIFKKLFLGVEILGWSSLIVSIFLSTGFIVFFLGILGEYVGRVFEEVKNRPLYVVKEDIGLKESRLSIGEAQWRQEEQLIES